MRKYLSILLFAVALLGYSARPARAQFIGYTSPQTLQQTLATAGTPCTGSTQFFNVTNLGQVQHTATIQVSAAAQGVSLAIIGFDNLNHSTALSPTVFAVSPSAPTVTTSGVGYYPLVEVAVQCNSASGTFSLAYAGASSSPSPNSGTLLSGMVDWPVLSGLSQGSTFTTPLIPPPFANLKGKFIFRYNTGSVSNSTLSISCFQNGFQSGNAQPILTFALAAVTTTPQVFEIPSTPCPSITITYTSGGASANTYGLDYVFDAPGFNGDVSSASSLSSVLNLGAILSEKGARWDVLSTPAVSTQATASKAAGASLVRHVADCVTWSAGAAVAPAATQLVINLRDGATGAGTIIWQTTINAAATAAQHGSGSLCGLNLIGTAATAMTLEFSALLTSEFESVTLTGYDVQ